MNHDRPTTGINEEMNRDDCLALLGAAEIGRIGIVIDRQPMIFPVNFELDGDLIVFRTSPGIVLDHAALDQVVFEVDKVDASNHEGWSVVVTGLAREITDALDPASISERSSALVPWASGAKEHWVRITEPEITGRHVHQ